MSELRAKDLNVGDRIRHSTFGEGFVTKYEPSTAGDVIITAAFDNGVGIKRLLLGKAPMEKIKEELIPVSIISLTVTGEFDINGIFCGR